MTNITVTEQLILRPLTLADADAAFNGWAGDLEVVKYVNLRHTCSIRLSQCQTIERIGKVFVSCNRDAKHHIIKGNQMCVV